MNRWLVSGLVALGALVGIAGLRVMAQGSIRADLVQPLVVDIKQQVPVALTLSIRADDGEPVEVTTPITIGIALQITLDGAQLVDVALAESKPVAVEIEEKETISNTTEQENGDLATPSTTTVNDEEVLNQLTAITEMCFSGSTIAQQQRAIVEYRSFFSDKEVQLTGRVDDVLNLGGEYIAQILLEKVDETVRVNNVPEEQALSLEKGDKVLISGRLEIWDCITFKQFHGTMVPR